VSHSNLPFIFFGVYVGNGNAFKYKGPHALSDRFNGIANMNFSNENVCRFEYVTNLDIHCNISGKNIVPSHTFHTSLT